MSNNTKINHNGEAVEHTISKAEHFLEKYKKPLIFGIVGIVAIVAAGFAYHYFYYNPKVEEAMTQTFVSEQQFRNDEFDKALNGDGNAIGFKKAIEKYGNKSGEAIYLYAGICALRLNNFQEAIDYLKKYDGKDDILRARALCNMGDAYSGLDNKQEAINYYEKAANYADNAFAAGYLMKAAATYEDMGKDEEALKCYNVIKDKYAQTMEGYEVSKYISRIEEKMAQK